MPRPKITGTIKYSRLPGIFEGILTRDESAVIHRKRLDEHNAPDEKAAGSRDEALKHKDEQGAPNI